jgi:hypothetical protein
LPRVAWCRRADAIFRENVGRTWPRLRLIGKREIFRAAYFGETAAAYGRVVFVSCFFSTVPSAFSVTVVSFFFTVPSLLTVVLSFFEMVRSHPPVRKVSASVEDTTNSSLIVFMLANLRATLVFQYGVNP